MIALHFSRRIVDRGGMYHHTTAIRGDEAQHFSTLNASTRSCSSFFQKVAHSGYVWIKGAAEHGFHKLNIFVLRIEGQIIGTLESHCLNNVGKLIFDLLNTLSSIFLGVERKAASVTDY